MSEPVEQKRMSSSVFIILIILLCAFAPISTDMYLPALGTIVSDLHTDEAMLNMTLYGYMLALAISMIILGPVSDKYGRKLILLVSLVEYIVTFVLAAFVQDVYTLIILRVLQAVGSAGAMTVSTAFVKDSFRGPAMSRVLGIVAIIGVMGPVLAPILGASLIEAFGWRSTFIAPGIFAVICLVMSVFVTETLPAEERVSGGISMMMRGMRDISRNRTFMAFMVLICLMNMPFMGYLSVSSYIYEGTFGFSGTMYSFMLAAALLGSVVVMVVINKLTSHVVNRKMLPLYLVMGLIGSIMLVTISDRSPYLFLLAFIFILGSSTTVRPWGMSVLMRSHPGDSGTLSSMINAMFFIVGTVGMICATLPWSSYIIGLGCIGFAACALYLVLMLVVLHADHSKLRQLDGTPAGDDIQ